MLDNSTRFYDGNSQGGIMGMALVAISTDIERFVLGVVGMNYSTLLPRSVDFDAFEAIFVPANPDPVDRAVALDDWQVSELTAMVAARTMRVPIHRPVTAKDAAASATPVGASTRSTAAPALPS